MTGEEGRETVKVMEMDVKRYHEKIGVDVDKNWWDMIKISCRKRFGKERRQREDQ